MPAYTQLDRGILCITGADRHSFLQGLVTQDIFKASPEHTVYSAALSAQGKFLFDFFVVSSADALYLDCQRDRLEDLQAHLTKFKLRSDVALSDVTDQWQVIGVIGIEANTYFDLKPEIGHTNPFEGGFAFVDPRLKELGLRLILPRSDTLPKQLTENAAEESFETYDQHRLALGVPDGSRDMILEKAIPLECNLDGLNAIDWNKGCYLGQELTSRTKHLGIVRKRLIPVSFKGGTVPFLTPLTMGEKKVGTMRTSSGGLGLALIRLEALESSESKIYAEDENLEIVPHIPEYLQSLL